MEKSSKKNFREGRRIAFVALAIVIATTAIAKTPIGSWTFEKVHMIQVTDEPYAPDYYRIETHLGDVNRADYSFASFGCGGGRYTFSLLPPDLAGRADRRGDLPAGDWSLRLFIDDYPPAGIAIVGHTNGGGLESIKAPVSVAQIEALLTVPLDRNGRVMTVLIEKNDGQRRTVALGLNFPARNTREAMVALASACKGG